MDHPSCRHRGVLRRRSDLRGRSAELVDPEGPELNWMRYETSYEGPSVLPVARRRVECGAGQFGMSYVRAEGVRFRRASATDPRNAAAHAMSIGFHVERSR